MDRTVELAFYTNISDFFLQRINNDIKMLSQAVNSVREENLNVHLFKDF